jgi:hypothetical protein
MFGLKCILATLEENYLGIERHGRSVGIAIGYGLDDRGVGVPVPEG